MQEINHINGQGQNYLVLIALNRFKHVEPLFYSVQDAQKLSQVLVKHFGFPESHIIRLFNERASHVAIWKTLEEVNHSLTDQDNLLIYYAGYSYQQKDVQDSFLLGYDSDPSRPYGLIYQQALIDRINKLNARNVFFMVNSGFSTELIQANPNVIHAQWEEEDGKQLPQVRVQDNIRWGMASMSLEENRESLVGDSPIFIRSIIKYLESSVGKVVSSKAIFEHIQHLQTYDEYQPIGGYLGELPMEERAFTFIPHEGILEAPPVAPKNLPEGEMEELRTAVRQDDISLYLDFIFKYPDSEHLDFVQERIRTLQKGGRVGEGKFLSFITDNALWVTVGLLILISVSMGLYLMGGLPKLDGAGLSVDQVELIAEPPMEEVLSLISTQMIPLEGGIFRTSMGGVRGISNFEISSKEVTQLQWKIITDSLPNGIKKCPNCPIEAVSFREVQRFIQRLNELTGESYRLPTSPEWEFAATVGGKIENEMLKQNVSDWSWHKGNASGNSRQVGKKTKNDLGIFDMYGNIWEWCFDRVIAGSTQESDDLCGDPRGTNRVIRGGGWDTKPDSFYVGISGNIPEDRKKPGLGFRLAKGGVPPCEDEMKEAFHYPAIEMVPVAGGQFTMGPDESGNTFMVQLPAFEIAKYELSQELWEAIMGENPSWNIICSSCPVETVNWDQVQEFISILNAKRNTNYRLPTEAEWEYAARGGREEVGTQFAGINTMESLYLYGNCFFGDDELAVDGDYKIDKFPAIAPVGSLLPNELGIYDLSGNVWELCQDWKGPYPTTPQNSPEGPASGLEKVIRGGGWNGNPEDCSISTRRGMRIQDEGKRWIGFRLVRSL